MIHYCVTGKHRTGTSMMMKALSLSGNFNLIVDKNEDLLMSTYHPSPDSNYLPQGVNGEYFLPPNDALPSDSDNNLIKVSMRNEMWVRTLSGVDHKYMIVWMNRDENERIMSWNKSFGYEEDFRHVAQYLEREDIVRNLPNSNIVYLNYKDVISNPLFEFQKILDAGWPIDPLLASAQVDPTLYRNRII